MARNNWHKSERVMREHWSEIYPGLSINDVYERVDGFFGKSVLSVFTEKEGKKLEIFAVVDGGSVVFYDSVPTMLADFLRDYERGSLWSERIKAIFSKDVVGAILAVISFCAIFGAWLFGREIPKEMWGVALGIAGFYFGTQVTQGRQ